MNNNKYNIVKNKSKIMRKICNHKICLKVRSVSNIQQLVAHVSPQMTLMYTKILNEENLNE